MLFYGKLKISKNRTPSLCKLKICFGKFHILHILRAGAIHRRDQVPAVQVIIHAMAARGPVALTRDRVEMQSGRAEELVLDDLRVGGQALTVVEL